MLMKGRLEMRQQFGLLIMGIKNHGMTPTNADHGNSLSFHIVHEI